MSGKAQLTPIFKFSPDSVSAEARSDVDENSSNLKMFEREDWTLFRTIEGLQAVFVNARGQIVVRQEDYFEGDMWIIVSAEHVPALIAALEAAAASPEAGFRQLEDEPELDLEPAPERIEDVPQPEPIVDQPDRRELIRAALLAGDKSNRQIAAELNCSEATVRRVAATLGASDCDSQCDSRATLAPDAPLTHVFEKERPTTHEAPSAL